MTHHAGSDEGRDAGEWIRPRSNYGLDHPTWDRPDCFYYATEAEARAAILKVYGEHSGHVVVRVVTIMPDPDAALAERPTDGAGT